MNPHDNRPKVKTECLIENEKGVKVRMPYDTCSSGLLETAKFDYREHFNYIGSSHEWYYDEVLQVSPKLHHFFKLK